MDSQTIISNGSIYVDNMQDYIKFDCGATYYTGPIIKESFPQEYQSRFIVIVTRSFTGYFENGYSITGNFTCDDLTAEDNNYVINIVHKSDFVDTEYKIIMKLYLTTKNKTDYLEEVVTNMKKDYESKLDGLTEQIKILAELVENLSKKNSKKSLCFPAAELAKSDSSDSEQNSDSDNDSKFATSKKKITARSNTNSKRKI